MKKGAAFQPLEISYGTQGKKIVFKNRYQIPPMLSWVADDKEMKLTSFHKSRYHAFAMGGFGSMIIEVTAVEANGRISFGDTGLWNDEQEKELKDMLDELHKEFYFKGVQVGIQIGHAGRKASKDQPWKTYGHIPKEKGGMHPIYSCSAVPFGRDSVPKELTVEEIKSLVKKFGDTAERAKRAGIDFIEVHGAHGYLINQFLSPGSNQRKDKYGGSFENRIRFLTEIVQEINDRIGEFPLFVRLSVDELPRRCNTGDEEHDAKIREYNKIRWTPDDSIALGKVLKKMGVICIDCSSGSVHHDVDWNFYKQEPCWQVRFSEAVKKGVGICTTAVGIISKAEEAEDIVKNGKGDFVQIGREALFNPYIPLHHAKEIGLQQSEIEEMIVPNHSYALKRLWDRKKTWEK